MKVTDHIRNHLLEGVGYQPNPELQEKAFARVRHIFDPTTIKFILGEMRSRILMGTFRYEDTDPRPWAERVRAGEVPSYLDKLEDKIALYELGGNKEFLIDAMNYLLLEFVEPCRKHTFYRSTERHE